MEQIQRRRGIHRSCAERYLSKTTTRWLLYPREEMQPTQPLQAKASARELELELGLDGDRVPEEGMAAA